MKPSLSREEFVALAARYSVVPLSVEILGDRETPVSVYEKLIGDANGFLLESVEGGEQWARWSFIGWDSRLTLLTHDGQTTVTMTEGTGVPEPGLVGLDPLSALELVIDGFATPPDDQLGLGGEVPPLFAGAVGFLGYDIVRYVEDLPDRPPDDRGLPEMAWQFFGMLAVVDRFRQTIRLVRNVFVDADPDAQYEEALAELARVAEPLPTLCDPVPTLATPSRRVPT